VHLLRHDDNGRTFLFVRRSGGRFAGDWWPVAGTREVGERPVETALRETLEETGLVPSTMYDTGFSAPHMDLEGQLRIYTAFVPADAVIRLNYEHTDYRWMTLEEAVAIAPPAAESFVRDLACRFLESRPPASARVWPG